MDSSIVVGMATTGGGHISSLLQNMPAGVGANIMEEL